MSDEKELPRGWVSSAIGDLCQVAIGFAFKSDDFAGEGIRLLRGENIEPGALRWNETRYWPHEKAEQYQHLGVSEGDIILAMDRPVVSAGLKLARASAADVPCLLVQRVARIRPKADLCWPFVYFGMQSSEFVKHLLQGQTGTQLPHISGKSISSYELALPPLNEQRRIVAKIEELFSDLDAGVAALERASANLKRYRAAVLKAAVEGKLTEQWRAEHPATEPASKLLDRILAERRCKWEADQLARFATAEKTPPKGWQEKYAEPAGPDAAQLPALPAGWCWVTVDQVGHVQLGRQRSPLHHNGPHMRPYLRVANVFENRIDVGDVMQMNFTPAEYETYRLGFGDILLILLR
jgi:type I restriction enzyme S subunit